MRIVLVDNLVMPERNSLAELDVHPHLGLLALAAVAEPAGHVVRIYDPKRALTWGQLSYDSTLYQRVATEVLSTCPDAVGFTTLGCSFVFAIGVAAALKRTEPDLPILLGGPHATMLHGQILERFPQFDIVVRHEADETFPHVLEHLGRRNFDAIPGISWRASGGLSGIRFTEGKPKVQDLDTLPLASYDHYPVLQLALPLLRIEAGRGCPFNCTFCSTAGFFQRSFRLKSAGRLVSELDRLHALYGFSDFKLDHDMFTVNRRKVVEFCEAVRGRGYRWRASARVDCVDHELLATMAESGCVSLYFGIESGSARMQKICQKRLDLDLVHPILDAAAHLGIDTTASFITGFPEETEPDQDDTLDMLGRCYRRGCLTQLHILAPEPGTPMFDRSGAAMQYDGYGGPYNAGLVADGDLDLVLTHPDIFSTYYYYPAGMERWRYIFAVEAVDLLRRAGPIVVQYLLRAFEGRLSRYLAEFRRFAECRFPGTVPDGRALEAHLAARFGTQHHLTSLFRYALRASSKPIERAPMNDGPPPVLDARAYYQLNPNVHLLTDLHDCGALIERITHEPPGPDLLDDSETGERGVYLIKVGHSGATSYRIDPGVEAILRLFEHPRTRREVEDLVCCVTGVAALDTGFFDSVVRAGVIIPGIPSTPSTNRFAEMRSLASTHT